MNSSVKNNASLSQANSVQSQFVALSRDKEKFHKQIFSAERDSKRAQERLQSLKAEQVSLMTKIQKTQEELGVLSRKQAILKDQSARVQQTMKLEQQALKGCANHMVGLEQKEEEAMRKYSREMGSINDETVALLNTMNMYRMLKFVSVESVETVVAGNLPANAEKEAFQEKLARMKAAFEKYQKANEQMRDQNMSQADEVMQGHASQHLDIFYGPENSTKD